MDLKYKLYLERANNEIKFADISFMISNKKEIQLNTFKIDRPETYYSAVISHAYYCIFYSAKAYLEKKGIKTNVPEEHRKTYLEFRRLVIQGIIDKELLRIYDEVMIKADDLLGIFKSEKKKRGEFTYKKLSRANKNPAEESLKRAKLFFRTIYNLLKK